MIHQSYRIWFSQRNGSTLLCEGLAQTGVAGIPLELFNIGPNETLQQKYGVTDYDALLQKLWQLGSTSNGVFGIKQARTHHVINELIALKKASSQTAFSEAELWDEMFPNCKHIFLTRRNKVRQAVSWWKAIQDGKWHLRPGETHQNSEAFYEEKYNFDALLHLWKETMLRECWIQEYFTQQNIQPMTLVYEDFIQNFPETLNQILDFLEIDSTGVKIDVMPLAKTSSSRSEEWVQRFRKDLQKGWERPAW